jgi:hypothetical protein
MLGAYSQELRIAKKHRFSRYDRIGFRRLLEPFAFSLLDCQSAFKYWAIRITVWARERADVIPN